ncbi:MAG: flagellar biosynthetic protein FliO [Oligoflexales bacterium]
MRIYKGANNLRLTISTILIGIFFLSLISKHQVLAAKESKEPDELISINKVAGESGKKLSIVTIYLNRKPKWKKIDLESHGTFLQLSLKNTLVPKPGKFYDIDSPYFSKMVLIQSENNEAVIRVFTNQEASLLAKASDIDILNKRIVLTANHDYLTKLIANNVNGKENQDSGESGSKNPVENKPNETKNSEEPNKPFALDTETMPSELIANSNDDTFRSKLIIAAYFSIAMILLLLLSLTWRRLVINKKLLSPRGNIPMQALNQLVLAPKQKLSLVQVGHEKLLLSVSPEGISLITHIPEKSRKPENPKTSFGEADKEKMQTIMMRNLGRQQQLSESKAPKYQPNHKNAPATETNFESPRKVPSQLQRRVETSPQKNQKTANKPQAKKKIEYAIDDDGIHKTSKPKKKTPQSNTTQKAIDDVTQLIRDKLKSLPKI